MPALLGLLTGRNGLLIPRPRLPSIKNGTSLSGRDAGATHLFESGARFPMRPSRRVKLLMSVAFSTSVLKRIPSFLNPILIANSKAARVVFEGCHVKDEGNNWAIFSEITSCPATMEAGKAADAFGLLPGHEIQVADGESAYTQAKLGGPATWVRLPKERWLPEWHGKYHDPVVRRVLALYGHPDAGGFWEQHCEKALRSVGFEQCPDWKSVFRHPKLNLMLVVYVDDFKLSGPKANLAQGWSLMASKIKLEPPSSIKRYLGCEHVTFSHTVAGPFDPRSYWTRFEEPKKAFPELTFGANSITVPQGSTGSREVRMIKYDMRSFMEQCVARYVELCGPKYKATLRSADMPFLDESRPEFDVNPDNPAVNRLLGHPSDSPTPPGRGVLGDCAAAVLMKILYGARMGRYDLIRPVQALASLITKWDGLCDKKLHRLVCYINSTLDLNLYGWIGDPPDLLELVLYCDADLAGDRTDSKSTSGVFMCLLGPRSFMPLNALSKKQTSVSKSTPEAKNSFSRSRCLQAWASCPLHVGVHVGSSFSSPRHGR